VVELPRGGRTVGVHRSHGEYDAQLTGRGRLSVYLTGDLAAAFTPVPGVGRGRPRYPDAGILIALVLRTLDGLALRQTQGRVADLLGLLGHRHLAVPDHTTLSRRLRTLDPAAIEAFLREVLPNRAARRAGGVVLAVDGTGLTLSAPGPYYRDKHHDKRRGKYLILHVGIDTLTGEVLAHVVTASTGPGSGDASQGPVLVAAAHAALSSSGARLAGVVGDGAYSGAPMFTACAKVGTPLVPNMPDNAAYGSHPDRDAVRAQHGRHGKPEWKKRSGYHERSLVESWNGALKRTIGERVASRREDSMAAEVHLKVLLYSALVTSRAA
jgi:hypothetical protein